MSVHISDKQVAHDNESLQSHVFERCNCYVETQKIDQLFVFNLLVQNNVLTNVIEHDIDTFPF
jgi:hypothetical protein